MDFSRVGKCLLEDKKLGTRLKCVKVLGRNMVAQTGRLS